MTGTWSRAALLAACVLSLGAVGSGCGRAHRHDRDDRWAAAVAGRHREADRRLDEGDAAGARAVLRSLVDDGAAAPGTSEHRLALQDTYFRLAWLALGDRDGHQALAYADAGLALGGAPHVFVANLLVARGAAHEALGDAPAAAADYHRALVMNEALLHEALAP